MVYLLDVSASDRVNKAQAVNLVAKELDAHGLVRSAQEHVDDVAVDTECPALEICLRAAVEGVHELVQQARERAAFAFAHLYGLGVEVLRVAYAVEAADAGHHYHVAPPAHEG